MIELPPNEEETKMPVDISNLPPLLAKNCKYYKVWQRCFLKIKMINIFNQVDEFKIRIENMEKKKIEEYLNTVTFKENEDLR